MDTQYFVKKENVLASVRAFLKPLVQSDSIAALLVPMRSPGNLSVMPALVSDSSLLDHADPFSPSFQVNGAKLVSKLTRRESDETVAVFLRPCEVRAFVELVKLHQARWENLMIISADCVGAFSNRDFNTLAKEKGDDFTLDFIQKRVADGFQMKADGLKPEEGAMPFATACQICDQPFPDGVDIAIHYAASKDGAISITVDSEKGALLLEAVAGGTDDLVADASVDCQASSEMKAAILKNRQRFQKEQFDALQPQTSDLSKLTDYFSACINCYNCRVACPICYCKECVFNTDVVDYEPFQYAAWARSGGMLKMPEDTLFFHMTRMIHMGLSCVGCGQCSNACPNDIPLAELFKMVGLQAQKGFDYLPGKDVDEPPPLSVFYENEYEDVTG